MSAIDPKADVMTDDERAKLERQFRELASELRRFRGRKPNPLLDAAPEGPQCSFCGLAKNQVQMLVEGPRANICNECVELCQDMIGKRH